jgi:hypothetical protein
MKVKCDRDYASFLKGRYHGRWLIEWRNGVMTVTMPALDLSGICEE